MAINTHNLIVDFGKHKGERWTRLPISYLKWLVNETKGEKKEIAQAELDRRGTVLSYEVEISGHAVDSASLRCRKIWHEDSVENEGLHSWLHRISNEALEKVSIQKDTLDVLRGEGESEMKLVHKGMKLVFVLGAIYPTLKTVMLTKKGKGNEKN